MNPQPTPDAVEGAMPDIRQRVTIRAPLPRVRDALLAQRHLRAWWTREADVAAGAGVFRWSGPGFVVRLQMRCNAAGDLVTWDCTASNMQNTPAWIGSSMVFQLTALGHDLTRLDFVHTGYRASSCHATCAQGWAFFLGTSLRQYLESGSGLLYPQTQDTRDAARH